MKSLIILSVGFFSVFTFEVEAEDKVYKWIAEDGAVIFSDTPPPGVEVEEMEMPAEEVAPDIPAQRRRDELQRQSEQIDRRVQQRQQKREAILKEIDEVRAQIARVKAVLDQGSEPTEGERQRLAGGGSKLSPAYFERIARQEKEVEDLEKRISELLEELQSLR